MTVGRATTSRDHGGGDRATLWFSPDKLHVFDPESGVNLTRDEAKAERLEADARDQRTRALERAKAAMAKEETAPK
ncbi:hypothetical protein [Microbacterium sp.]|uniref:hypothetical protein n=1 Tax=Microbacterium sp. TaxID=51671 RepID=UPI003736971B